MKNALEAMLETACVQQNSIINREKKENSLRLASSKYANLWCNGISQEKIDNAIQSGETFIKIILMEDSIDNYLCWKMIPYYTWDRGIWNRNANAYFDIPRREGFIVDIQYLTDILNEAKYAVRVIDSTIKEATSKTGRQDDTKRTREITISWNNVD